MSDKQEISENEYYLLNALVAQPLHGYAIRQKVEHVTGGKKKLSFATLYETLYRLLQKQYIEREGDKEVEGRIRRIYRITPQGERALIEREQTLELLREISQLRIAENGV